MSIVKTNHLVKPPARYPVLDSMRGLAALSVVFYHYKLMWPPAENLHGLSARLFQGIGIFATGHEAVMLFFLLSGFVLTVPYLRGKGQTYVVFLVRRILRIYGPYLVALSLAIAGAAMCYRPPSSNTWANETWTQHVSGSEVLKHVLFLGNFSWAQYNTAFWSLVLEMRISIVFPVLLTIVTKLRVAGSLFLASALALLTSAILVAHPTLYQTFITLRVASIFIAGILLAENFDQASAWYRDLGRPLQLALAAICFCLYTWGHHINSLVSPAWGVDELLITLGAVGYVVIGLNSSVVRSILKSAIPLFLGRISYSLYLIHGTVLFVLAFLFPHLPAMERFALYLVSTIPLAFLFCISIEEPFVRAGRRFSKWAEIHPGKTNAEKGDIVSTAESG